MQQDTATYRTSLTTISIYYYPICEERRSGRELSKSRPALL